MEEDKNKRGGKEYYFDLIHYRRIIADNWELFEKTFGYGNKGNKDKKTEYLDFINEIRKIVAHASSGKIVSFEDFTKLQDIHSWLINQIMNSELEEGNEVQITEYIIQNLSNLFLIQGLIVVLD